MNTFKVGELSVEIAQDEFVDNPRVEYDNFGRMYCIHSRYALGDKHDFRNAAALKEHVQGDDVVVCLALWLYDHGGLFMRCGDGDSNPFPFHDRWDSGCVGFIFCTEADVVKEYGKVNAETLAKVRKLLEDEVATYNQYLAGDVWRYVIQNKEGKVLESRCGYYGYDYAKAEAIEAAECLWRNILETRENLAYRAD